MQDLDEAAAETEVRGGMRVCTVHDMGPTIDGIPYGRMASNPNRFVSDPIDNPAVIERLLTIPGFTLVTSLSPEDEEAVERANSATRKSVEEKASNPGLEDSAVLRRTVDELTQANIAMSADLAETRAERDDLARRMSSHEVVRLQQQNEALRRENEQGGGASIALQQENEQLRQANAELARSLSEATDLLERETKADEPEPADAPPAAESMG